MLAPQVFFLAQPDLLANSLLSGGMTFLTIMSMDK